MVLLLLVGQLMPALDGLISRCSCAADVVVNFSNVIVFHRRTPPLMNRDSPLKMPNAGAPFPHLPAPIGDIGKSVGRVG
jgi:hypothetical protein